MTIRDVDSTTEIKKDIEDAEALVFYHRAHEGHEGISFRNCTFYHPYLPYID